MKISLLQLRNMTVLEYYKKALKGIFIKEGIDSVHTYYSGSSDNGYLEGFQSNADVNFQVLVDVWKFHTFAGTSSTLIGNLKDWQGTPVVLTKHKVSLDDFLRSFADVLINTNFPGYGNDEGADGSITIKLVGNNLTISLEHTHYTRDSHYSSLTF